MNAHLGAIEALGKYGYSKSGDELPTTNTIAVSCNGDAFILCTQPPDQRVPGLMSPEFGKTSKPSVCIR